VSLELIASTALALSTLVVATVVTIGTARAAGAGAIEGGSEFYQAAAIATALVVVLSGYVAIVWNAGDASRR
jgi:hypothetical protein